METNSEVGTKAPSGFKIKPVYMAAIAIAVIAAVGAVYWFGYAAVPVVAVGDTINVTYTGSFTNGTVFGSNVGGTPLQFTVGANELIPGFDQGVVGMSLNQNKTITVPENLGYGSVNPALFIQVPANAFGNQSVKLGMAVTQTNTAGQQEQGVVTAVNRTNVTLDFNSPLAGQTLIFKIRVLSIAKG